MPTPAPRAASLGLVLLLGGATFAACDAGDDTVYPNPLALEGEAGAAGRAAGGGSAGGKAGASGQTGGSGTGGSAGSAGGVAGGGGASGVAGASGASGATGAGASGSAGFGGASTIGGSSGAAGSSGSSSGAAGSGTGGKAGAGASAGAGGSGGPGGAGGSFDPGLPYDSACAALAEGLGKCGASDKVVNDAKDGCAPSKACANKLYIDGAPSKVLACLGAACTVASPLPSATDACLEQAGTNASKADRDAFKQKLNAAVALCNAGMDSKAAATLAQMSNVHGFYRPDIYAGFTECLGKGCTEAVSCLKGKLAQTCTDLLGEPDWIWPTDAVITNAVLP